MTGPQDLPVDPGEGGGRPARPSAEQVESTLGPELLAIHQDSYGRGASRVSIRYLRDTLVAFLDDLEFHPSEQFLIENGQQEVVLRTRAAFQTAIETTFEAAVERATGRRVISFASSTRLDPPYCVEVFRLAPEA